MPGPPDYSPGTVIGTALGQLRYYRTSRRACVLLFWGSIAFALAVAFVAAFPVNRCLISWGEGHAVVYEYHGGHEHHGY